MKRKLLHHLPIMICTLVVAAAATAATPDRASLHSVAQGRTAGGPSSSSATALVLAGASNCSQPPGQCAGALIGIWSANGPGDAAAIGVESGVNRSACVAEMFACDTGNGRGGCSSRCYCRTCPM